VILVNEAAEDWPSSDPFAEKAGLRRVGPGRPELAAAMRPLRVVVGLVFGQDRPQVPFTEDEQRQISVQLQQIKTQLKQFQLPAEQIAEVEERLDKLEEESHHLGRKDWLIVLLPRYRL
jgi:hypothetical protein